LLKHNNKIIFESWKQKLVKMVVTITAGDDVTTMAVKIPTSPQFLAAN
jgi:RNA binding exosome subunit